MQEDNPSSFPAKVTLPPRGSIGRPQFCIAVLISAADPIAQWSPPRHHYQHCHWGLNELWQTWLRCWCGEATAWWRVVGGAGAKYNGGDRCVILLIEDNDDPTHVSAVSITPDNNKWLDVFAVIVSPFVFKVMQHVGVQIMRNCFLPIPAVCPVLPCIKIRAFV